VVPEKQPTTPRPDQAVVSAPAETIAAIATAQGRGGVGVIRISGRDLLGLAQRLSGRQPKPRLATLANFHADDGSVIDSGLLLYFPAPHSFTGEDVLELQVKKFRI
jgi:tRNA modification GTPase